MIARLSICIATVLSFVAATAMAETPTRPKATIAIDPTQTRQTFDGMGCGTIFYSGHITSLGQRKKFKLQQQLYDDMFVKIPTKFLHVMIRPSFEPTNDNDDPYKLEFGKDAFKKNRDAVKVYKEARKRRPDMQIYATLYSPPPWMKTNGEETGGGESKATIKPGLENELGEYIWAYLRHMNQQGCPVHYLSISNEPDWGHYQPGYFLRPGEHAKLFRKLVDYFETMARKDPETPMPKLVAPNGISVINAAKLFLPKLDAKSQSAVAVIGSHDYDRSRMDRWELLRKIAGDRPVWCTEWCWNGKDDSPELIVAANASWSVMCDGFNHGLNAWMAYDWVYPPRPGGEALIHVNWGSDYHKTKFYHSFRQWSLPLSPGMKVVQSDVESPTTRLIVATGGNQKHVEPIVKAAGFVDPETGRLVIHIVNITEKAADFEIKVKSKRYRSAKFKTTRTDKDHSDAPSDPITLDKGKFKGKLSPREMLTWESEIGSEPKSESDQ